MRHAFISAFSEKRLTFSPESGMISRPPVGTTAGGRPGEMAELVEGARLEIV